MVPSAFDFALGADQTPHKITGPVDPAGWKAGGRQSMCCQGVAVDTGRRYPRKHIQPGRRTPAGVAQPLRFIYTQVSDMTISDNRMVKMPYMKILNG